MTRYPIFSFLLLVASLHTASGQSYYPPEVVQHRATVNYPDHTATFFTRPVKAPVFPLPDRNYYWYSANQIKVTQGGYSGKLLNGPYSDFYMNKNLKEQGEFVNGLKAGRWRSWASNGVLKEAVSWHAGTMNGRFYSYDDKGMLRETGRYKNGLLSGRVRSYGKNDSTSAGFYKAGKPAVRKNYMPGFVRRWLKRSSKTDSTNTK